MIHYRPASIHRRDLAPLHRQPSMRQCASKRQPNSKSRSGAGDETRTRDIQLGRNMHESEFRIAGWRGRSALLRLLTTRRHSARLSAAFSTARIERLHPGGRINLAQWTDPKPAAIGPVTATGRVRPCSDQSSIREECQAKLTTAAPRNRDSKRSNSTRNRGLERETRRSL